MNKLHIMLDLETLGKKVLAPIVQIGAAVAIEDAAGNWSLHEGARFENTIALDSAMEHRKPDASTILWWAEQNAEARASALREEGYSVVDALQNFAEFVKTCSFAFVIGEVYVWGNGASSDNAWLLGLYEQYGIKAPWEYWGNMCYRTMKNYNRHIPRPEIPEHLKHTAYADAHAQLVHLVAIMNSRGSHGN